MYQTSKQRSFQAQSHDKKQLSFSDKRSSTSQNSNLWHYKSATCDVTKQQPVTSQISNLWRHKSATCDVTKLQPVTSQNWNPWRHKTASCDVTIIAVDIRRCQPSNDYLFRAPREGYKNYTFINNALIIYFKNLIRIIKFLNKK